MLSDYLMSAEDLDMLRDLIPDHCVEPLRDGSLYGLVMVNEDSQVTPVVGVVLYRFSKGYLEIEWVAEAEGYDLPDHGSDMVMHLLNKARVFGGVRGIRARFREGDPMAQYFPEPEFSKRADTTGVYRFALGDVEGIKGDNKKRLDISCIPLAEADDLQKNSILAVFDHHENALPLSRPVNWNRYEQELSCIYCEEKTAKGIILLEKDGDELVLALLYSGNPIAAMSLLKHSFHEALRKYGEECMIACPVLNSVSEELVKKIVNDPRHEERILAEVNIPMGTGTLFDFAHYAPNKRDALHH